MIVGIVGKMMVGKSETAKYLVEKFNFKEFCFATELKEMLIRNGLITHDEAYAKKTGWSRRLMQATGQLFRTEVDKRFWILKLHDQIDKYVWSNFHGRMIDARIVISDVRHNNEANYVLRNRGILLRISRDMKLDVSEKEQSHVSETEQDEIICDHIIYNNRTIEDLHDEIESFFNSFYH